MTTEIKITIHDLFELISDDNIDAIIEFCAGWKNSQGANDNSDKPKDEYLGWCYNEGSRYQERVTKTQLIGVAIVEVDNREYV